MTFRGRWELTAIGAEREEDVLAEGQDAVVRDVARLTERLLQLLLDLSLGVQQVNLGILLR